MSPATGANRVAATIMVPIIATDRTAENPGAVQCRHPLKIPEGHYRAQPHRPLTAGCPSGTGSAVPTGPAVIGFQDLQDPFQEGVSAVCPGRHTVSVTIASGWGLVFASRAGPTLTSRLEFNRMCVRR
ncbi:hypothetical protein GCM10010326_01390 [Streptomyces xanthochromogenes]|uniref:Uncharacterized protein n=1 Tax=Streptomyces xanthochromogenes TaxID=67384 RepID=A0ABQ2ZHK9_9ACTN|nr:hypothetical protein GCM10010326_01390 [Streptomyces xanthochromogenes]